MCSAYNDASRLPQVQDATGTYSFLFDNMGRLKQTTTAYSFVSGNPFTIVYGYDAASNRTSMTIPLQEPSGGEEACVALMDAIYALWRASVRLNDF